MKRITLIFTAVCLMLGTSVLAQTAAQQQPPAGPPPVVLIYREDVKAGMIAAHNKLEAAWPRAFAKAGSSNYYFGLASISGPGEALFVEPHTSFESVEKNFAALEKNATLNYEVDKLAQEDSSLLNGARTMLAVLNQDLTRQGGSPLPAARYVLITTYRVRPGRAPEFIEFRKLLKSVHEKEKTDNYFAVYQVTSGAPSGTYMAFRLLKSLKELDPDTSRPAFAQLLGENNQKKLNELAQSFMISSESALFGIKPEMSYMPKEFIAQDTFWAPKPRPALKSAVKKDIKVTQKTTSSQ